MWNDCQIPDDCFAFAFGFFNVYIEIPVIIPALLIYCMSGGTTMVFAVVAYSVASISDQSQILF